MGRLIKYVIGSLIAQGVAFGGFCLAYYLPVLPFGSYVIAQLLGATFFFLFFCVVCILPLLFLGLFLRKYRYRAVPLLLVGVISVGASIAGVQSGQELRMNAFRMLAIRSAPLLDAIAKFEAENGCPPSDLLELIPGYLDSVPSTGMGGYPKYQYFTGDRAREYEGNNWVLVVDTPGIGIDFDFFVYFPNLRYSRYGASVERFGDWAYIHD